MKHTITFLNKSISLAKVSTPQITSFNLFISFNLIFLFFFFSSCSNLFYQPDSKLYSTPDQYQISYESISFFSLDQVTKLHGWYMHSKREEAKGLVVYFHGNAQNISSHFFYPAWLTQEGFDVFIFDYRGYGQSEGNPSAFGVHQDALAALIKADQLFKEKPFSKNKKFIVYGHSLGGTILLRALIDTDRSIKNKITLSVIEGSFASYQSIAADKLKSSWLTWMLHPLSFLLISDEYAPSPLLGQLAQTANLSFLIIHGKKDTIIPPSFGEEIFNLLPSPLKKNFWLVEDGFHGGFFYDSADREMYRKNFLQMINR